MMKPVHQRENTDKFDCKNYKTIKTIEKCDAFSLKDLRYNRKGCIQCPLLLPLLLPAPPPKPRKT